MIKLLYYHHHVVKIIYKGFNFYKNIQQYYSFLVHNAHINIQVKLQNNFKLFELRS